MPEGNTLPTVVEPTADDVKALTASFDRLAAAVEKTASAPAAPAAAQPAPVSQPAPVITQETEAAAAAAREKAAAELSRGRIDGALLTKLLDYQEQRRKDLAAGTQRTTTLAETVDELHDEGRVLKDETKSFFGRLGREAKAGDGEWNAKYCGRSPMDVLINNAWKPCERKSVMPDGTPSSTYEGRELLVRADDELLNEVRDLRNGVFFWTLQKAVQTNTWVQPQSCPIWKRYAAARRDLDRALGLKALDTTDTSSWVPTGFSTDIIPRYELETQLLNFIRTYRVPRWPHQRPRMGMNRVTLHTFAEPTADHEAATRMTSVDPGSGQLTFNRINFSIRIEWSLNMDEDSIVEAARQARYELERARVHGLETAILNGDATGAHMDTDTAAGAATLPQKAWDGLRQFCIANAYETDINATHTTDGLGTLLGLMGKYAIQEQDLGVVMGPRERSFIKNIKEISGLPVVISTGQAQPLALSRMAISILLGANVLVSEHAREDLNLAGVNDGVTTNNHDILFFNRTAFVLAYSNEAPEYAMTRLAWETWQTVLSMIVAHDFEDELPIGTEHTCHRGFNIDN